MSGVLTSNKLIRSIKRRAMIPSDQNTFTDEDFLEMLNEEIQYFGVPHLLRTHEEYLLVSEDFELDGRDRYEIPYRALGNKLREVSYVANASSISSNSVKLAEYNDLLSKLDLDVGLTDTNYFSTLQAITGDTLNVKLDSLNSKLVSDDASSTITSRTFSVNLAVQQTEYNSLIGELNDVACDTSFKDYTLSGTINISTTEQIYELSRISVDDLPDYNNYATSRYAQAFHIENNAIVLLGELPLTNAIIRMHYYLRPNTFVVESKAGIISDIDTVSGVITLKSFPTAFSNSPDMDFVKHRSPNIISAFDITPLSVDSVTKTVTFTPTDLPSTLRVGDHLNIAQETIVPQLPVELHAILAQRVALAALEALGDQEGLASAQRRLDAMEKSSNDLIDNRVEGAPEKITNRHGTLRAATISNRSRGGS